MSNRKYLGDDNEKPKENLRQTQKKKSRRSPRLLNKSTIGGGSSSGSDRTSTNNAVTVQITKIAAEFQLERTSTPHRESMCEHCKHSHLQECCMYVYDSFEDIKRYSIFKHGVEKPYGVTNSGEDFSMKIGASTPTFFPGFTDKNVDFAKMRMLTANKPPVVYFRQYFWPFLMPPSYQLPPPSPVYNVQPPIVISNYVRPDYVRTAPIPIVQQQPGTSRQVPVPLHYGNNYSPYDVSYMNHNQHLHSPLQFESPNYVTIYQNANFYCGRPQ